MTSAFGAVGNGVLALQSDGGFNNFTNQAERAFVVRGSAIPEPSSALVLGMLVMGAAGIRRGRAV